MLELVLTMIKTVLRGMLGRRMNPACRVVVALFPSTKNSGLPSLYFN